MRPRLSTLFSALSLLTCVAVCALWLRSYRVTDAVRAGYWDRRPRQGYPGYGTATDLRLRHRRGRLDVGTFPSGCVDGPGGFHRTGPGPRGERITWATEPAPDDAGEPSDGPGFLVSFRSADPGWLRRSASGGVRFLSLPDGAIVATLLVLPVMRLSSVARRRHRSATGRCATCGAAYPATGLDPPRVRA